MEADQAILVVEAMKMELTVSAPTAGVLKAICCELATLSLQVIFWR